MVFCYNNIKPHKEVNGIINNGNILTDGRCFKNCR